MTIESLIFISIYFGSAIVLALTAIAGAGISIHVGSSLKREPLPWIFFIIAAVIMAGPIASGRNLSGLSIIFEARIEEFIQSLWFNRIGTLVILLVAIERILRFVVSNKSKHIHGWPLLLAFLGYALTNQIVNGIYGTRPYFSHHAIYSMLLAFAAVIVANYEAERCIRFARNAVLSVLLISAVVALLKPQLVIQSGYAGGLISIRYWGLGSHANTLSPLTVLFLALLWLIPYRYRMLNFLAWIMGLGSLLLTQSKTALLSIVVVLSVLAFYRYRAHLKAQLSAISPQPALLLVILFISLLVSILTIQIVYDFGIVIERFFGTRAGIEISSLTNRDIIWKHALIEWERNPFFGYGPALFDYSYRQMIGIGMAFHAHNQFMQSLGSAGIIGVSALLIYIFVIGYYAIKSAASSKGLSLSLFVFVLIRSMTEVPLNVSGITNPEFFIHLVLIIVCIGFRFDNHHAPVHDTGVTSNNLSSAAI